MGSLAFIVHAQIRQQSKDIDQGKTFPHTPCNRAKVRQKNQMEIWAKVNHMETWAGVKVARNPDWRRCDHIEHVEIFPHNNFTNQATLWMEIWIYGNMTSSASCENGKSWWLNGIQYLHQASLTFSFKIIEKETCNENVFFRCNSFVLA